MSWPTLCRAAVSEAVTKPVSGAIFVYTPGLSGRPQPRPQDTSPMSRPWATSGPPLSPWQASLPPSRCPAHTMDSGRYCPSASPG